MIGSTDFTFWMNIVIFGALIIEILTGFSFGLIFWGTMCGISICNLVCSIARNNEKKH